MCVACHCHARSLSLPCALPVTAMCVACHCHVRCPLYNYYTRCENWTVTFLWRSVRRRKQIVDCCSLFTDKWPSPQNEAHFILYAMPATFPAHTILLLYSKSVHVFPLMRCWTILLTVIFGRDIQDRVLFISCNVLNNLQDWLSESVHYLRTYPALCSTAFLPPNSYVIVFLITVRLETPIQQFHQVCTCSCREPL